MGCLHKQLSLNGDTNLTSEVMHIIFKLWGVTICVSSAHYPQYNGQTEGAIKTWKRLLCIVITLGWAVASMMTGSHWLFSSISAPHYVTSINIRLSWPQGGNFGMVSQHYSSTKRSTFTGGRCYQGEDYKFPGRKKVFWIVKEIPKALRHLSLV